VLNADTSIDVMITYFVAEAMCLPNNKSLWWKNWIFSPKLAYSLNELRKLADT